MFDELNAAFPNHTHFYEVKGMTFAQALERCARIAGDSAQVFNFQGKIVAAATHDLGNQIEWLQPVSGSPIDVEINEE